MPSARARSQRSSLRSQRRRATNGTQERPRVVAERSRLEPADARREDVRRPGRIGGGDSPPPARHAPPPRPPRPHRQGRHDLPPAGPRGWLPPPPRAEEKFNLLRGGGRGPTERGG